MLINSFLKRSLVAFYRSKGGKIVWKKTVTALKRPFIRAAVLKALADSEVFSDGLILEKKIGDSHNAAFKCRRHALVVFPFFGLFGSGVAIISQCRALRELGYVVHAVCYSDHPDYSENTCFDFYYQVQSTNPLFGKWNIHKNAPLYEQNEIDDWSSEDLLHKVDVLNRVYSFDICICHYNWLSSVLTVLPSTYKIIYTHDCHVRRNEKLSKIGLPLERFWFSCSAEEEKKGLERADLVLSIQEEETNFFKNKLGVKRIETLPYVPKRRGELTERRSRPIFTVGYIGGTNPPNLIALKKFLEPFCLMNSRAKVLVAGGISKIFNGTVYKNVEFLGLIGSGQDDLQRFYDKCDLIINPDTLVSGIKIKTLEAMAFHKPIVCTKAASIGLGSTNKFHLLTTAEEVAQAVFYLTQNQQELADLKQDGDNLFNSFSSKYDVYRTFNRIVTDNMYKKYKAYCPTMNKTDKTPAVSVVVPCYNVERYIRQALLSLLVQGFRDIEIIAIVDDAGEDHTFEIIKELASMDKRIIAVRNEKKLGYGGSMNKATKLAKGDFICILEPDDWVDSDMIGTLYESIKESGCSVVKGGYFRHSASAKIEERNYYFNVSRSVAKEPVMLPSHSEEIALGETSYWSAIYRKSFLEEKKILFPENIGSKYLDTVWKFFVYSELKNILLIPQSFYHYRVTTANSSSNSASFPLAHFKNFNTIREFLTVRGKWDMWKENWAKHFILDLRFHEVRLGKNKEALNEFYMAARKYLLKMREEGLDYENFDYPRSLESYYTQEVVKTIKRITSITF